MFSAFQYDVYVWYGTPEHLDAITTINGDMFYCILASKRPSQKKKKLPDFWKKDANRFFTWPDMVASRLTARVDFVNS